MPHFLITYITPLVQFYKGFQVFSVQATHVQSLLLADIKTYDQCCFECKKSIEFACIFEIFYSGCEMLFMVFMRFRF